MTDENDVQLDDTETQDDGADGDTGDEETSASSSQTEDTDSRIAKLEAELKASNEARDKLYARLKRKDGESHQSESGADTTAAKSDQTAKPALSREEGVLIAQGHSLEEVEYAQKVATLQSKPLLEAVTDPLFTTWKANREKEAKEKAAQLPTSKGAKATVKKSFNTPGLSDDEHKELFNANLGR